MRAPERRRNFDVLYVERQHAKRRHEWRRERRGALLMMMILWAYAGLTGAIVFSLAAAALMVGMPVGDALMLSVRTGAWMISIAAVAGVVINELRTRR
jgi:hypothetical protein